MDRGGWATTVGAVVLVAAVLVGARLELSPELRLTVQLLPELLAVPAALLAARLGLHRALAASALIVALNRVGGPDGVTAAVAAALLALIVAVPERRVLHPGAALHVVVTAAALPAVAHFWPDLAEIGWIGRLGDERWSGLTCGLCLAAVVVALRWRRSPLDAAIPWLIGAAAVARLDMVGFVRPPALVLGAAQALVVLTLAESGHLLAYTDRLTALPNRRAFDEQLQRLRGRFTIAMADVDRFKLFNDRWGHEAGDQALRLVATELSRATDGGRVFRFGGEEFAIVYPGRAAREVADSLERVRRAISERGFVLRAPTRPSRRPRRRQPAVSRRVPLTVSIGAASPTAMRTSPGDVLRAADRALYRAKRAGRDCVVLG